MLTKSTQDALQAELALLNQKSAELDFARAILLQALGLADKDMPAPLALPDASRRKPPKFKKAITSKNRENIIGLVKEHLTRCGDMHAASMAHLLNKDGYAVTPKGIRSFLARLLEKGIIGKSYSSTPQNKIYTMKGIRS